MFSANVFAASASAGTADEGDGGGAVTQKRVSLEVVERSQKEVLKLYKRAVDILRDKRERELLAEALCDVGDLHVSEERISPRKNVWMNIFSSCSLHIQ